MLALLDVNDRTASDSLDMIDKTHLLVLALAAAVVGDSISALPAPAGGDSSAATSSAVPEALAPNGPRSHTGGRDRQSQGRALGSRW